MFYKKIFGVPDMTIIFQSDTNIYSDYLNSPERLIWKSWRIEVGNLKNYEFLLLTFIGNNNRSSVADIISKDKWEKIGILYKTPNHLLSVQKNDERSELVAAKKNADLEQLKKPASFLCFNQIITKFGVLIIYYIIGGTTLMPLPWSSGVLLYCSITLYTTVVILALPPW